MEENMSGYARRMPTEALEAVIIQVEALVGAFSNVPTEAGEVGAGSPYVSEEAKKTLQDAFDQAGAVLADSGASEEELKKALAEAKQAIAGFNAARKTGTNYGLVDKTELERAIAEAEAARAQGDAWNHTLEAARKVAGQKLATQPAVDQAAAALEAAGGAQW